MASALFNISSGFLNNIGEMEGINTPQKQLREKNADLLEHAILGIQARTDLSPQEKTFQIGEARKQLQGLYEPHEGQQLFARLGRLFGKKDQVNSTPAVANDPANPDPGLLASSPSEIKSRLGIGPSLPTSKPALPVLKPGMTIDDVLAAGSAQQGKPKPLGSPIMLANGQWAQMTQMPDGSFQPQPIPGYSPASAAQQHLQDLRNYRDQGLISDSEIGDALKIGLGLEAKAGGKEKQAKVDRKDGVTVLTDEDGNQYTSLKQIPKGRADLIDKFSTAEKQFSDAETNKEVQSLRKAQILAQQAFDNALVRGDVVDANKAIDESRKSRDKIRESVRGDQLRYNMMLQAKKDAETHPDSENEGSFDAALLAFHLGMTMGAVKGMRQGKDIIQMHQHARSLPEDIATAADSWVTGRQLSDEQRANFLRLAKQKLEASQGQLTDANSDYDQAEQKKNDMVESATHGRVKAKKAPKVDIKTAVQEVFGGTPQ